MTETDVDRRAFRIVLVSHGLLTPLPGSSPTTTALTSAGLVAWAEQRGDGIYQLPVPGFRLLTGADATTRRRLAREDAASLDFVFGELARYLENGYEITGLVLDPSDEAGPTGQAWRRRLERAADAHGVRLDPVWRAENLLHATPGPGAHA